MFSNYRAHVFYRSCLLLIRNIHHQSCAGCEIPPKILEQIDRSSMSNSVNNYRYHLCIGQSIPASQWPKDIKRLPGNYFDRLSGILLKNKDILGTSIRVNSVFTSSLSSSNDLADWYLFPTQIKLSNIHRDDIEELIEKLFINKSSIIHRFDQIKSTKDPFNETNSLQMNNKRISLKSLDGLWVLACCHQQRDQRCGVIGPLLIKEIEKYAQKINQTDHIHCLPISHIGGHRFAGNIIIYPSGTWYGRVLPCHIPSIIQAYTSPLIGLKEQLQSLLRGKSQN